MSLLLIVSNFGNPVIFQVSVEGICPRDCFLQSKTSDPLETHYFQSPKCPVSPVQQQAGSPELQNTSRETGEEEEVGSDSSALQMEETSVLTNGGLSEEEEDVLDSKSILPSSVLDQASVIADCFMGNQSRRSSLVSEDLGSFTCPSPSKENDIFKSPSSSLDEEHPTEMLTSSNPEPNTTSENICSTPENEHTMDILIKGEHRSTLSKQDRLLIHKIRRYYEHAEHQDANFSVQRRESLSYIPAGLVRQLSRQLNSIPQDQAVPLHRKVLSRNRPTSWSVFDLPGLEKSKNTKSLKITELQRPVKTPARSQSFTDGSSTEEEFISSSEMLKVWQDMEVEEENQKVNQSEKEKLNESVTQDVSFDTSEAKTTEQMPQILGESEISTPSNSSSLSSSTTTSPAMEGKSGPGSPSSKSPLSQETSRFSQSQLPKIISFQTSMAEDQILQDMGKMKNKVFQLARQYSQRIKNNRPTIWQRNRETANQLGFKSMPAVHEETMQPSNKGK